MQSLEFISFGIILILIHVRKAKRTYRKNNTAH